MTRQPAATAFGAYSRDTCAPAQNSARSQCAKSKSESSCTGWLRPRKLTLRPRERLLASAYSCATGKPRSSRTVIRVSPMRPVAPITATANCPSMRVRRPPNQPREAALMSGVADFTSAFCARWRR